MLPNVLQPARLITSRCSRRRSRLLDVQPGDTIVDATFGAGGHAALLVDDCVARAADRDRPRPVRPGVLRAAQRRVGGRRASCAASSRLCSASSRTMASGPTRSCSTSASRACSSTGRNAGSRMRSTRRSTCAWTVRGAVGGRARQRVERARAPDDLPAVRGGALRAADRAGDLGAGGASRSSGRASSSRRSRLRSDPGAVRRRPPCEARLPGAPDRGQRRAGRARGGPARRGGDAAAPAAASP